MIFSLLNLACVSITPVLWQPVAAKVNVILPLAKVEKLVQKMQEFEDYTKFKVCDTYFANRFDSVYWTTAEESSFLEFTATSGTGVKYKSKAVMHQMPDGRLEVFGGSFVVSCKATVTSSGEHQATVGLPVCDNFRLGGAIDKPRTQELVRIAMLDKLATKFQKIIQEEILNPILKDNYDWN